MGLQVCHSILTVEQQRVWVEEIENYQWQDIVSGRSKQSLEWSVIFKARKAKVVNFHGVPHHCEWLFGLLKCDTHLGMESMHIAACLVQKICPGFEIAF